MGQRRVRRFPQGSPAQALAHQTVEVSVDRFISPIPNATVDPGNGTEARSDRCATWPSVLTKQDNQNADTLQ